MVSFIYVNSALGLGVAAEQVGYNNRTQEMGLLASLLKDSEDPEDLHQLASGDGKLLISDFDRMNLLVKPCSGLLELHYFLEFIIHDKAELNYCVEEYYTTNQYDDEYCISLKTKVDDNKTYIVIDCNQQSYKVEFDIEDFKDGLRIFGVQLTNFYIMKFPFLREAKLMRIIEKNISELNSHL